MSTGVKITVSCEERTHNRYVVEETNSSSSLGWHILNATMMVWLTYTRYQTTGLTDCKKNKKQKTPARELTPVNRLFEKTVGARHVRDERDIGTNAMYVTNDWCD